MKFKSAPIIVASGLLIVALTACGGAEPIPTPTVSPTDTSAPPTATHVPGPHPSGRTHHEMVYDSKCDQVVLFGGTIGDYDDPTNATNEVWTYDLAPNTWFEKAPWLGPQPMSDVAAAYDSESNVAILFGGGTVPYIRTFETDIFLDETWAYSCDTDTWKEMAKGPIARLGNQMVYHTASDRIILFGGAAPPGQIAGGGNDTWVYDFNEDSWQEMAPSTRPPKRYHHAMAYDSESDKVLVWGGKDLPDPSMWAYDLNNDTWEKMAAVGGPLNRNFAAMVYDSKADRVILYGGLGKDDTWAYDYNSASWTEMKPETGPGKLAKHSMVYDPVSDKTILFGGRYYDSDKFTYMDETWIYDFTTNTWTDMTPTN
jgi:hypothetical protein